MNQMTTELGIMLDGLKRKEKALEEILAITENQQTVIKSAVPFDEVRKLVFEMNQGKQEAITIVKDCDNMFESMLKRIGKELEETQSLYADRVKIMQAHIRRIMDLDVKIRATEEENNKLLDVRREEEAPTPTSAPQSSKLKPKVTMPTNSAQVIEAYKQGHRNFKG